MMKVLWVQFAPFGIAGEVLGMKGNGISGGWIASEYDALDKSQVEVSFLCCSAAIKQTLHKKNDKAEAWCLPAPKITYGKDYTRQYSNEINGIINQVKPDLIHLWGTETFLPHIVTMLTPGIPKVLYVQGLLGMHERYVGGYITGEDKKYYRHANVVHKIVGKIRDRYFKKQVEFEHDIINNAKNVITDNQFTRAYCNSVSSGCRYYSHALLPSKIFTEAKKWNINTIERNTIFALYSLYPEKGLQQLLKALKIIKRDKPDIKVLVPGPYHIVNGKLNGKGMLPYETWLNNFIVENGLIENIEFVGPQSPAGMLSYFQKAHIFVNTSCMEVHSSTLREAMTVGTPSVSTLCGSVAEYLIHGENGLLYRYEEPEVLAWEILTILKDDDIAAKLSQNAISTMDAFENQVGSVSMNDVYKSLIGE